MPTTAQYACWFAGILAELLVVVFSLSLGLFRKYLALNLYMATCVIVSLLRFYVLTVHSFESEAYRYLYFYSDCALTIVLYLFVLSLFLSLTDNPQTKKKITVGLLFVLGFTALFTYDAVNLSSARIFTHFAYELSQNLFFVGLPLSFLLLGLAIKKRAETKVVLQLSFLLALCFGSYAVSYGLSNSHNYLELNHFVANIGLLFPLGTAYVIADASES